MSRLEILWARKTNSEDPHESILALGGRRPEGQSWALHREDAIRLLETGERDLFVRRDGFELPVVVTRDGFGHKLLLAAAEGLNGNALVLLPEGGAAL